MSEFSIEINKCNTVSDSFKNLKVRFNSSANRIGEVSGNLDANAGDGIDIVKQRLAEMQESVINSALRADSLAEALIRIVSEYRNCEGSLCQNGDNSFADNISDGTSSWSWWTGLINWLRSLFGMDENESGVTREAERTHDLYMQNQIFDIMAQERFNRTTWNNASVDERRNIMNSFLLEIMTVMGISLSSSTIVFQRLGSNTRGGYSQSGRCITINSDYLQRSDSYQIMQTLIHEMRHAYQHAVIDNPDQFQVSAETVEQWRENFAPGNYYNGNDYRKYVSQPIEYDAKNFAKQYGDIDGVTPEYAGSW